MELKAVGELQALQFSMTYLIATVKEKHKLDICFVIHDSGPPLKVVLIAGETVYKESELFLIFLHSLIKGLIKNKKPPHV